MIKFVQFRSILGVSALITLLLLALVPVIDPLVRNYLPFPEAISAILNSARFIALAVAAFVTLFFWNPVWRFFWKLPLIGALLADKFFPDINGDWKITVESNWPTVDAMRQAARDNSSDRFDVLDENATFPSLSKYKFNGRIEQSWRSTSLEIFPNPAGPLNDSRTLAVDLIQGTDSEPKRIAWVFRQTNKAQIEATDEDNFLGAALLRVISKDELDGYYWNNRSWRKGLNAAGLIKMTRA